MRFTCINEDGADLLFQCDTVRGDIQVLVYFEADNLDAMLQAFDNKSRVNGVTCETTLLVQVRQMIDSGCSLVQMHKTLQTALTLVDDAMHGSVR